MRFGGHDGASVWAALTDVVRALPEGVRVVLLRAKGPSFPAGTDRARAEPAASTDARPAAATDARPAAATDARPAAPTALAGDHQASVWCSRPDLVSIAAVQGEVLGAGLHLALACDLRVAADDAQFALLEVTCGLLPDLGSTARLVELIGYPRALEVCLTGRRVRADEALGWGLVNAVVPDAQLHATARDLAAAVLASSRDAVVQTKALLQGAGSRSRQQQCEAEREAQARLLRDLAGTDRTGTDRTGADRTRVRE